MSILLYVSIYFAPKFFTPADTFGNIIDSSYTVPNGLIEFTNLDTYKKYQGFQYRCNLTIDTYDRTYQYYDSASNFIKAHSPSSWSCSDVIETNINNQTWSNQECITENTIGTETDYYYYFAILYNGMFYKITFVNYSNNNTCNEIKDKIINSLNFN